FDILDDHHRASLDPRPQQELADLAGQVVPGHVRFAEQHDRPAPRVGPDPLQDLAGGMPVAPSYETQPASRRSVGRDDLRPGLPGHRQQPPVAVPRIPPVTIVMDATAQLLLTDRSGEELIEGPLVAREDHLHEEDEAPGAAREMAEKVGG